MHTTSLSLSLVTAVVGVRRRVAGMLFTLVAVSKEGLPISSSPRRRYDDYASPFPMFWGRKNKKYYNRQNNTLHTFTHLHVRFSHQETTTVQSIPPFKCFFFALSQTLLSLSPLWPFVILSSRRGGAYYNISPAKTSAFFFLIYFCATLSSTRSLS